MVGAMIGPCGVAPAAGGDAAITTAFLARTSGLSAPEIAAYKAMLNGLVTDGFDATTLAPLDALYIFATKDTTTASLNICNTNFGLTPINGPLTFTADVGWTGTGVKGDKISTGFTPSTATGVNYSLDSASLGIYDRTSRAAANTQTIGTDGGGTAINICQFQTGSVGVFDVNEGTFPSIATTTSQGFWVTSRTASNLIRPYRNGVALTTIPENSASLPVWPIAIFDFGGNSASSDQLSAAFIGGGLSAGQVTSLSNRINGYMTALGVNVY